MIIDRYAPVLEEKVAADQRKIARRSHRRGFMICPFDGHGDIGSAPEGDTPCGCMAVAFCARVVLCDFEDSEIKHKVRSRNLPLSMW